MREPPLSILAESQSDTLRVHEVCALRLRSLRLSSSSRLCLLCTNPQSTQQHLVHPNYVNEL
jgi:hypothetical protein